MNSVRAIIRFFIERLRRLRSIKEEGSAELRDIELRGVESRDIELRDRRKERELASQ